MNNKTELRLPFLDKELVIVKISCDFSYRKRL